MSEMPINSAEPRRLPRGRLWFGFTAPPAAWAAHGLLGVWIAKEACVDGDAGGVRVVLGGLTLLALAVTTAAGLSSWRLWRVFIAEPAVDATEGKGRQEFMALGGLMMAVIFTIAVIWGGLPLFMRDLCEALR